MVISYELFNKRFSEWYMSIKIGATNENPEIFFKKIIKDGYSLCFDDIYEDEEAVITKVYRIFYLESNQSVSGQVEKFEWIEIKLGMKDDYSNIVRSKTIGYEI